MPKAMVTGGAGFVGSHLVDRLVADDLFDSVVVYDNLHAGRVENIAPHIASGVVEFIQADVRDVVGLEAAMADVKVVFHLAGQSTVMDAVRDIDYSIATNVLGTYNVIAAARHRGVERVVYTSSREVYGEPAELPVSEDAPLQAKNPYGASKIAAEMCCHSFSQDGIRVATVRVANAYGPRDRARVIPTFAEKALRGDPLTIYGGKQVIDFVWVGDVVDVLYHLGICDDPPSLPVNVGSGIGTSILDLAERILELTNSESEIRMAPPREVEVVRFVADTHRLQALMGGDAISPPLERLDEVVQEIVSQAKCGNGGD